MPRSSGLRCALDVPALRIRSRLTPARLANGKIVMIKRGFVPERRHDAKTPPRWQITGPPGGLPKPGKLKMTLSDNYLQYALT
jgi:cytochrome oxidase assembly protein ShyY1